MNDDSGEPARDWRSVDRDELIRLLSSGLTPAQIGELYGRSTDAVRLRARQWDLDCRALRARSIGLVAKHPQVAAQFVEVVDGAPLGYSAQDLLAGSGARCRWLCEVCGEEWVTSVANRTKRRSGCPACADRQILARARARTAKTSPLSAVSEELVTDFVENLSRPDRDAHNTPSGSQDRIRWRCRSGHEWETTARQRVKHRTQCPICLAGLWTSRLEHEVAALVQLATGLEVRVGATKARIDRRTRDTVDLHVVEADFLCDLDPSRWHRSESATARDQRKLERLAGQRYARIRPALLGRLATERAHDDQQVLLRGDDETDPWLWASAVIVAVGAYCTVDARPLSSTEKAAALTQADLKWRRLRSTSRTRSLLSEFPTVAAELVRVVDRPGITAVDLAPQSREPHDR